MRPSRADAAPSGAPTDLACACATARQVARLLTQLYDGWLRGAGVEAPQFALLMTLEKQGATSQAALGRRYAIDKTTISRNLKLLERNGWVAASKAEDGRERRFTLTPAGRKRLAAARPKWKQAQEQLRSSMTASQWAAMFRTFTTVASAARAAQRAAAETRKA
jgi:DNA-binding MarR family transcriptional regulator